VDYIFRRLALDYLPLDERMDLGILSTGERTQQTLPGLEELELGEAMRNEHEQFGLGGDTTVPPQRIELTSNLENRDAPFCYSCGNAMQRAGSCFVCSSCGSTSGCS
jgi:ribonucleoside-diphosphate reductase alpha chain